MLASGVPPNDACHKDLLAVFKNEGRLREAIVLVKSLGNEFKHVASKDFIPSIVRALCSKVGDHSSDVGCRGCGLQLFDSCAAASVVGLPGSWRDRDGVGGDA